MRVCLVCGEKATIQFKNQHDTAFCGEGCAKFHFIGVKRNREDDDDLRQETLGKVNQLNHNELVEANAFIVTLRKRQEVKKAMRILRKKNPDGFQFILQLVRFGIGKNVREMDNRELKRVWYAIKRILDERSRGFTDFFATDIIAKIANSDAQGWDILARMCSTNRAMGVKCAEMWPRLVQEKYGLRIPEWATEVRAYAAAVALVMTATVRGNRNFIIWGPNGERATVFLGDKGWGDTDNEQANLDGPPTFYDLLRNIVENQFDDDSTIHRIDFSEGNEAIMIDFIEPQEDGVLKSDLIKLFYHIWALGGYRWTTPTPQSELRTWYKDGDQEEYEMDTEEYQRFIQDE